MLNRIVFVVLSLVSLGGGLFLACNHPVAPQAVTVVFFAFFLLFAWQPRSSLYSLPLFLPLLNFSPWTGWLVIDEFDLLVLAVVAAGYFRMRWDGLRLQVGIFLSLLLAVALLVAHGANDLAVQDIDWFSGYITPLNSLRVGKSLLWLALLSPLIARACDGVSSDEAGKDFFAACLLGSCWVVLAALWERSFYPGLLDVSTPYRTVALFWEMHQGGAALDGYLVLIAPLLVWVWRVTDSLSRRFAIGVFVLAFVYVCLTTFSRGVFGAIAGGMVLLGVLLALQGVKEGRSELKISRASIAMLLLIGLEITLVLGGDSFMSRRLATTEHDFAGRLQHWRQGINLLKTQREWLFGIGLGMLPTRLTQGEAGLALPGAFYRNEVDGRPVMVIAGPEGVSGDLSLGGFYALSQRVSLVPGQSYRFAMDARSDRDAEILVQVCAVHLLYHAGCQSGQLDVRLGGRWRQALSFSGNFLEMPFWQRAGHGVLLLSVLTPGAKVEISDLHLFAGDAALLRNAQFLEQGAGWFPAARFYFLPWHIDNFYLEILIETGIVGLSFCLVAVLQIIRLILQAYRRGSILAPYWISCVAGLMALGAVVSVVDMPRIAILFGLFLLWAGKGFSVRDSENKT